jgi:predicted phosphoribosyltransferase
MKLVKESLDDKKLFMVIEPSGDGWDDAAIGLIKSSDRLTAKKEIGEKLGMDPDEMKFYAAYELEEVEYQDLLRKKEEKVKQAQAEYDLFKKIL